MKRSEVLRILKDHKAELFQRFGLRSLALFGSTSRDTARQGSDVDIIVTFDPPATSSRYFGLLFCLEDLLGAPVDLVTSEALRPELRPYVEAESIRV